MKRVIDGNELNRTYSRVWYGVSGSASMRDHVRDHVQNRMRHHVQNRVWHHVGDRVRDCVWYPVGNRVRDRVAERMRERMGQHKVDPSFVYDLET